MTKAEEIKLYIDFVEGLPKDSYLHDILRDTVGEVEFEIQSDFDYSLVGFLKQARVEKKKLDEELIELRQTNDKLKMDISNQEYTLARLGREWQEVKDKVGDMWFSFKRPKS